MLLRRYWRWALAVAAGLAALVLAYAGWLVVQVQHNLTAATQDVDGLKSEVLSGDLATVDQRLEDLRRHSRAAESKTSSPVWALATHLPVIGDDLAGIRVVSQVAADLSGGVLREVAASVNQFDSLVPRGARIDLPRVTALQAPVANAAAAISEAEERLNAEDPGGYVGALKEKFRTLRTQVRDLSSVLDNADAALTLMPTMLGETKSKNYLLVVQNNAEVRATGGLPGAVSLISTKGGRIEMAKQVAGAGFGERDTPVLPLTQVETTLFDEILGTYFVNANLTPDFPRSAALWKARWEEVEGDRIDGVISIDPVTLSYLLAATGPIEIDGTRLTSDTVVDHLLHQVYLTFENPADQDVFFRKVATAVFDKVTSGTGDPEQIVRALARASEEHRVFIWGNDDLVAGQIAGTAVAGELTQRPGTVPQIDVAFNDGTGSKMSYFLRYKIRAQATSCVGGVQTLTGSARVSSTAPADAGKTLPGYVTGAGIYDVTPGDQLVQMLVLAPAGGEVSNILVNGEVTDSANLTHATLSGRPAVRLFLYLEPGKTWDISWRMKTGADQTGAPHVTVTPSITAGTESQTLTSAC